MKKTLFALVLLALPLFASAQVSGQFWQLSSGNLKPTNSGYGLQVPSLANLNCIGTNASGIFGAGTCSGGGGGTFPFTPQSYGNSTSTTIGFLNGLFSVGSTTISGLTSGLVGNTNGLLYGFASSSLFGYTPVNPTRNINTTYPLQGGGNLSSDLTLTTAFGTTTNAGIGNNLSLYTNNSGVIVGVATSSASFSIGGNAGTATKLATGRTLAITGDLSYTSPSFDGSGNVTAAGTLATVNSNVGSFTNANITVNGKGLITAASNGTGGAAYPFTPSTDGGINTSATSTPIQGTNPGLGLDVSATSWYGIGGKTLAYASSTNRDVLFGLSAGGNNATTSATLGQNNAFGFRALGLNTTGNNNTSMGDASLELNTTGNQNTALGSSVLDSNITGSNNTGIGYLTLINATASNNTALGYQAGSSVTTGYSNTIIGDNSVNIPTTISSGFGNIGIGSNIFFPSATANRQLNIGDLIYGTLPATTTSFSTKTTGKVGLGTSTPIYTLDIFNPATSTVLIESNSATQGGCIILKDIGANSYTEMYSKGGILFTKVATSLTTCN